MTCMVTFECQAKAGTGEQLLEKLRQLLPNTRDKEGFIDLVAYVDQDNPDKIMCVQQWKDRGSYEAYVAWRKDTGDLKPSDKELGGHPLAETPVIRFFDPTDA